MTAIVLSAAGSSGKTSFAFFSSVIVLRAASSASLRCAFADDSFGLVGIDVRILEQPEPELRVQHRPHEFVDQRFRERAFADQLDQDG